MKFIEPILMEANDSRVIVNGRTLPVPFRVLSEDNYQILIHQRKELLEAALKLKELAPKLWGEDTEKWPRIMDRFEKAIKKSD